MSIKSDYHLHSHHSGDSDAPMEEMVKNGIAAGLEAMCFTEHVDFDFRPLGKEKSDMFELKAKLDKYQSVVGAKWDEYYKLHEQYNRELKKIIASWVTENNYLQEK